MIRLRWFPAAWLAAGWILASALPMHAAGFDFLAIGDMPYGETDGVAPNPDELAKFDRLIEAANGLDLAFTVHVGDIKAGSVPCRRSYFEAIRTRFDRFTAPLVFTPGDNEWTDCHRKQPPGALAPLEALAALRAVFYPHPHRSLGKHPMTVQTQADSARYATYVENTRWQRAGVVFATLHVVGGNDNLPDVAPGNPAEQAYRSQAALTWLGQAFALARQTQAPGIVLFMQADPWQLPRVPGRESGYTPLLQALEREVTAYPGAVLLMHGDGHTYCLDHPLPLPGAQERFTRVQVFGFPAVHGVRVRVEPKSRQVFTPSAFAVPGNPIRAQDSRCPRRRE
jgi:hypothetical protein